jgi:hypothetical protein
MRHPTWSRAVRTKKEKSQEINDSMHPIFPIVGIEHIRILYSYNGCNCDYQSLHRVILQQQQQQQSATTAKDNHKTTAEDGGGTTTTTTTTTTTKLTTADPSCRFEWHGSSNESKPS